MAEYKNEQGPYLIVTCGNTGSGKTGLMIETLRKELLNLLKKELLNRPINIKNQNLFSY